MIRRRFNNNYNSNNCSCTTEEAAAAIVYKASTRAGNTHALISTAKTPLLQCADTERISIRFITGEDWVN